MDGFTPSVDKIKIKVNTFIRRYGKAKSIFIKKVMIPIQLQKRK